MNVVFIKNSQNYFVVKNSNFLKILAQTAYLSSQRKIGPWFLHKLLDADLRRHDGTTICREIQETFNFFIFFSIIALMGCFAVQNIQY